MVQVLVRDVERVHWPLGSPITHSSSQVLGSPGRCSRATYLGAEMLVLEFGYWVWYLGRRVGSSPQRAAGSCCCPGSTINPFRFKACVYGYFACVCVAIHRLCAWCLQREVRTEEGFWSPGTKVQRFVSGHVSAGDLTPGPLQLQLYTAAHQLCLLIFLFGVSSAKA